MALSRIGIGSVSYTKGPVLFEANVGSPRQVLAGTTSQPPGFMRVRVRLITVIRIMPS